MKKEMKAWINWSEAEKRWVLRLWIDNAWEFSKSWAIKDENENVGIGWVCETILCEIAHLQDLGYEVRVTV